MQGIVTCVFIIRRISGLRRAFTLVEVVVVIVVLLALMAVAVPAFLSVRSSGQDTSALSNLNVAQRTTVAFLDEDYRYGNSASEVVARLSGSEPNIAAVVSPALPAVGDVQVSLHDEGRTVHLCTVSGTAVTFCLAMNSRGQLDDGQPTIALVPVYRSWGHTPAAAACWLPTATTVPAETCATGAEQAGGVGWVPQTNVLNDADDGEGALGALPANHDFEDYSESGFASWTDESVGGGYVHSDEGHSGANAAALRTHLSGSPVGHGVLISEPFAVDTSRDLVLYATGKVNEVAYLTVQFIDADSNVVGTPVYRHQASEKPVYLPPPWQKWEPITIDTGSLSPGAYRLRLSVSSSSTGQAFGVWVDTLHYEGDDISG